jgi:hypothetical protein
METPPTWFVEPLMQLALATATNTIHKAPITRISVSPDFGLTLGIAPGTALLIHTMVGQIEVCAERTERMTGTFRIDP